jgi:hypothetical protein
MKFLLPALAFFLAASSALAIEVSEEMLNTYVKQGLAERVNRNVQLLNPKVALLEGASQPSVPQHVPRLSQETLIFVPT